MKTETILYLENGETLHLLIHDNRDMVEPGETCIESHLHYPIIGRYQIFYVPESWDKNKLYTSASSGCHVRKVVYHIPADVMPTYDELYHNGRKLASAFEGTCMLYRYMGSDYVVLSDNSVITHEQDIAGDAIFPNPVIM